MQAKTNLSTYKKNIASQFGEDGIFEELFRRIGPTHKGLCVEVGSWDGKYCSNTWNLWHNKGWNAILIEGNPERHAAFVRDNAEYKNVTPVCAFVEPTGERMLDSILSRHLEKNKKIDLLSIDIDGDDYYIWDSLQKYTPRVVVIEYNPTIPPHLSLIQEPGQYFGASARALVELGTRKGYELIALTETNLIFILQDELPATGVTPILLEETLPPELFSYVMSAYDGTTLLTRMPIFSAIDRPLSASRIPRLAGAMQFIPVHIRRLSSPLRMALRPIKRGLKRALELLGLLDTARAVREMPKSAKRARVHRRKQAVLREYKTRYGLSTLVETGTYRGDMVEAMKNSFSKIHSIELGEQLYTKAKDRFANMPAITIHHGDSGEVLASLLPKLPGPALFWLDAHYSRGDTVLGSLETPVMQELTAILESNAGHVILIDDARDFNGTHDYPTISEIEAFISRFGGRHELSVRDDIIRITPAKTAV